MGTWVHFDEILRCNSINSIGVYDCAAHYPILIEAIKQCSHLGYCSISSRIYIRLAI